MNSRQPSLGAKHGIDGQILLDSVHFRTIPSATSGTDLSSQILPSERNQFFAFEEADTLNSILFDKSFFGPGPSKKETLNFEVRYEKAVCTLGLDARMFVDRRR
jgi:hypothetical protein